MKPVLNRLNGKHLTFLSLFIMCLILFFFHLANAGSLDESEPEVNPLRKGPYLIYNGNNTQMRVMWQLNETKDCTIHWGTDVSYDLGNAKTNEFGNDHQHSYTIKQLTPGKKYFYNIHVNNSDTAGSFVAGLKDNKKKIKFFVYGDARTFPYIHNEIADSIVSAYKKDSDLQTFVLFAGDMVTFGAEEFSWDNEIFHPGYLNIRQMMASLPLIFCVGNHERFTKDYKSIDKKLTLFRKYFPYPFVKSTYWSFDYGPAHIVILDQYSEDPEAKQLAWLAKDLESTQKPWKFVVLHEPGWSAGIQDDDTRKNNETVQQIIQPVLEKNQVMAVFAGHNHYYARALVNGIYHITTGGGGGPLYEPKAYASKVITTSKSYHYCVVDINKNVFMFKAIKPDGTIIDSFTLNVTVD